MEQTPRKQNLFDIEIDLQQIAEAYDQLEESGTTEAEIMKMIEAYFGTKLDERGEKLDAYAAVIRQREVYAKIRQDEAKRLSGLAKTDENTAQGLKKRLHEWMNMVKMTKTETKLHKFWIQNNGGVRTVDYLREPTIKDMDDKTNRQFLEYSVGYDYRWDDGVEGFVSGPQVITYRWDHVGVLNYLVRLEREVAALIATLKIKADALENGLLIDIDADVNAYLARNELGFAKLNPVGTHVRIK